MWINVLGDKYSKEYIFEIRDKKSTIEVPLKNKDDCIKLNSKTKAFIRIKYKEESLKRIIKSLKEKKFSTSDKSGLLSDTMSFMKSETVSHDYVINIISSFLNEEDNTTLDMILMIINNYESNLFENLEILSYI